jgi:hypothetical protein
VQQFRALIAAIVQNMRISFMAQTKFGAGERVSVVRSGAFSAPSGAYRIVAVLPRESGPQQYRVRNDGETFDRVLDEARLEAVRHD